MESEQSNEVAAVPNFASDARFIELQKELLLLQKDLLAARGIEEPRFQELQSELEASQNDSLRLNDEFKSVFAEFEFLRTLWPGFSREEFASLCASYGERDRRFGGVKK